MKKRQLKSLNLNKTSISNFEAAVKGGALPPTFKDCEHNTGCVGPPKLTCGIINCMTDYGCDDPVY